MIKPSVGRVVLFYPRDHGAVTNQPWAATITYVHTDRKVNLMTIDPYGSPHPATGVPLVQEGDKAPDDAQYCEWMPYQTGTAKAEWVTMADLAVILRKAGIEFPKNSEDERSNAQAGLARLEEIRRIAEERHRTTRE